jgi:hypothetical protein
VSAYVVEELACKKWGFCGFDEVTGSAAIISSILAF